MKRKIRSGKQLITIILFFYFVLSSTFVSKIYAQSEAVINLIMFTKLSEASVPQT